MTDPDAPGVPPLAGSAGVDENLEDQTRSWEPLLTGEPGGRRLILEIGLVVAWFAVSFAVLRYLSSSQVHRTTTTLTTGWLFAVVSGVMVIVLLAFGRVARHRIRQGLSDADEALRSIELVTDPALSFHPLEVLLDELLRRTLLVVGGDVATIYLVTEDGRHLSVRSSRGPAALVAEGGRYPIGRGLIGAVADRATATIVNDVTHASVALVIEHERVASLVAAPLLMGTTVTGVIEVGTSMPHRFRGRDLRLLQLVADRSAASIERARLDDAARRNRLGAEHARQHLALLARSAQVLATALESYEEALGRLVDVVVPSFADWFAIDLVGDEGDIRRIAVGSQGAARTPVRRDAIGHRHPDGDRLVRKAMATGRPEVVVNWDVRSRSRSHQGVPGAAAVAAPASGVESMLVIPIRVRGLAFGALSFTTGTGRRGYRRSDLETAEDLAERIAVTVQRVLLWRESREAERAATHHAEQLRLLMEAAFAVNAALAEPDVVRVLVTHAHGVLEAEHAAVVVTGPEGTRVEAAGPGTLPPEIETVAITACAMLGHAGRLSRSDADDGEVHAMAANRGQPGTAARPWIGVPLAGGVVGRRRALVVVGDAEQVFSTEDESALELLAQMGSVSFENARLYQAVRDNEQRLRAVVESSPLAIAELDLQGVALSWNRAAAELFGWSAGTALSAIIPEVVRPGAQPVLPSLWDHARHGSATVGAEIEARPAESGGLELSVSAAPLYDHAGEVNGILAVIADVTERKRMLDQFNQAERLAAMARLAGGVAHDFNNLLTVILGSSEVLERRLPDDAGVRDEVAAIRRAGERAAALTSELLAIGHRGPVRAEVVELGQVVAEMAPMLQRIVEPAVGLVVVAGTDAGHVFADPAEIERVVLNLVINARDAMSEGGRVEVRTDLVDTEGSVRPQFVSLSVADTGHGMDPETAEHCFEPFFTTKGRAQGTGLGLAAVHAVVTQAGGYITLETAPGAGTTFTVWLPAVEDEAVALSEATAAADDIGGEELVMVVEDEDDLRRLAAGELARRGYAVLSVSSGAEALSVVDGLEVPLDLLVTDVVMPEMSGVTLAAALVSRFPDMPVLLVSGHADDPHSGNLLADGSDFLAKPYTPQQLARRVRVALDRSRGGATSGAKRAG